MNDEKGPGEALGRAAAHGRRALSEALAALGALIEAGGRAALGPEAEQHEWLQPVLASLEGLRSSLEDDEDRDARDLLASVHAAVDEQIHHWERQSEKDPSARSVLRAFLAVRELLWEFGARGPDESGSSQPGEGRRLTRIPVDS